MRKTLALFKRDGFFYLLQKAWVLEHCLFFMFAFLLAGNASACFAPPGTEEKLKKNDLVFTGKVLRASCDETEAQVEFEVHDVWKSEQIPTQTVTLNGCREVAEFQIHTNSVNYLIFVKRDAANKLRAFTACPGAITPIYPRWREWVLQEYEFIKRLGVPLWSFDIMLSVHKDLEYLGKPKYLFKVSLVGLPLHKGRFYDA